jgi:hypothetical protein
MLGETEPRPIIFLENGKVSINFARYMLLGCDGIERAPNLPQCTALQVEALDVLEALAKKHQLLLNTQAGDLIHQ